MAKDTITVDGEERVVREDTAKAYRGVNWMLISIAAFVVIVAIVAATFFFRSANNGSLNNSQPISNSTH